MATWPKVECPTCQKEFNYHEGEFRPFCSERCRMVDLGNWLNESYRTPVNGPLTDEDIEELEKQIDQE